MSKDIVHSFLMIGQSNMAGRGFLKDVGAIYDEQIKMLVNGRWQTMAEPVNPDRPTSGIGLAASFAGAWRLKNTAEQIGLIPCADGGTSLDDWAAGGTLFSNAVHQAGLARQISTLEGILWHQGENDSFSGRSESYYDKLHAIVDAFRKELNTPRIPFVMGGLGDYLSGERYGKYFTEFNQVNKELQRLASEQPDCYYVSSSGLTANPDGLHFDAVSQRRFGIRYFEAMHGKRSIFEPLNFEDELIGMIENRQLTLSERSALLEISFGKGTLTLNDYEQQLAKIRNQKG